jgi:hypothetical protein
MLVLLASAARAADPTPAPDSIAAAKKDLAAMKAPVSLDDSSGLPAVDMKDLGPVPGAGSREMTPSMDTPRDLSLDPAKRKPGTGNWLVDAMDLNTSSKASRAKEKDDVLKGDPDLIRVDEKGVRLERDPLAIGDRDREQPKEVAEKVYNPLDAFMSDWVSARDRDLLLTPSNDGRAAVASGRSRSDLLPGMEVAPAAAAGEFTISQVDPAVFDDSKAQANPYLSVVDPPPLPGIGAAAVPGASGFDPMGLQEFPRGPAFPEMESAAPEAPRSVIPDFAQPPDDDKYFKQLKKF